MRIFVLSVLSVLSVLLGLTGPGAAQAESAPAEAADQDIAVGPGEMTLAQCQGAVAQARTMAAMLPDGDLSRTVADSYLDTALNEAMGGDVDECPLYLERAKSAVIEHRYVLRPGERLGMPMAEMPVPGAPASAFAPARRGKTAD